MNYQDLFRHSSDSEIHNRIYIKKPAAIGSKKDVEYYYSRAAQEIAEAESIIETLKEYQKALYERYQEITAANYTLFLFLERRVHYDNTKSYVITISKKYDGKNIEDETVLKETYDGKERHKALKRYEALKKEYPNIQCEADIAKKHWER